MAWVVTHKFKDWDNQWVEKGTLADTLVARGGEKNGVRFYNLISGNTVVSVTEGRLPVEEVK